MRFRTGLIIAALFIVGMFLFDRFMLAQMNQWSTAPVEITPTQRLLAGIAMAWDRFWWLGTPAICGLMWLISLVTHRPSRAM